MEEITTTSPVPAEFVALSPYEVDQSRDAMRTWAKAKVAEMKGQRIDLQGNRDVAAKHGWPTAIFDRQISIAKRREEFYQKIDAALGLGYLIVPNFQMTVFAVRTKRANPDAGAVEGWSARFSVPDVKPQVLPEGEGRYVSVRPQTKSFDDTEEKDGKKVVHHYHEAVALIDDPVAEFPMALAKPRIIEATQRALAEKLFDEIGVADGLTFQRNVRADPIILGRLRNPRPAAQSVSFFIAWTADLRRV